MRSSARATRRAEGAGHPSAVSSADLVAVSRARVFFAHQSVGGDILAAIPNVYATHGLPAPRISELADAAPGDRLIHTRIGANGDPRGKITEFGTLVRRDLARTTDIAVLKLCYADIRTDTDVQAVFAAYRDTMTSLREDCPDVTVVLATVPLTTTPHSATRVVRQRLRRKDKYGPEDNLAREEFNALLRAATSDTGLLFDVAAIESTAESGKRITGRHRGQRYYALDGAKASDHGHLNEPGRMTVANGLLAVLAKMLRD